MNEYQFSDWVSEGKRELVILRLRKFGYCASLQEGKVRTNASRAEVLLTTGQGTILN